MENRTFTIIKPNAVADGNTGKILDMITSNGFRITALRMLWLDRNKAMKFYSAHKGKPFFEELVEFMTSGPIVVALVEKDGAVNSLRELVGSTDPAKAAEGTIRKLFAADLTRNAIHASDSDENAIIEWKQFFDDDQIME